MGFERKRVIALESRRAEEMATLIRKNGGEPFVAPSMREVPIEANPEVFDFYSELQAGVHEMVILLTGVGTRAVEKVLASRYPAGVFAESLRRVTVVPRGPKPQAVLREWGVPWAVTVPSPNTWRELMAAIASRPERRIAVQEYGRPNEALLDALRQKGCTVRQVRVYQWDLPEDTGPLREAARRILAGEADVLLLTTSAQFTHLARVAGDDGALCQALRRMTICSIGPTTTETLEEYGVTVDLEPSVPKMGVLVKEAGDMIARKPEK
jgi:uroporphyrinogen-III synthase